LTEQHSKILNTAHDTISAINSRTQTLESSISTNSHTIDQFKEESTINHSKIEHKLSELETQQRKSNEETQQLLALLFERLGTPGDLETSTTGDVTRAVDPIARSIMEKTLADRPVKYLPMQNDKQVSLEKPPDVSMPDTTLNIGHQTYEWVTPFGRITASISLQDMMKKGKYVESRTKISAAKYSVAFVPAYWLYSKSAVFAFMKKVDSFGVQFSTPAVFQADEPSLRYLRRGEFDKLRDRIAKNGFLLKAVHEITSRTLLSVRKNHLINWGHSSNNKTGSCQSQKVGCC